MKNVRLTSMQAKVVAQKGKRRWIHNAKRQARKLVAIVLLAAFSCAGGCAGEDPPAAKPRTPDDSSARGKAGAADQQNTPTAAHAAAKADGFDPMRYLPDGADVIAWFAVATHRKSDLMRDLVEEFPGALAQTTEDLFPGCELSPDDLHSLAWGIKLRSRRHPDAVTILRTIRDVGFDDVVAETARESYQPAEDPASAIRVHRDAQQAIALPDARTVIVGPPETLKKVLSRNEDAYLEDSIRKALGQGRKRDTAVIVGGPIAPQLLFNTRWLYDPPPGLALLEDLTLIVVRSTDPDGLKLEATIHCDNHETPAKLVEMNWRELLRSVPAPLEPLLERTKVSTHDRQVELKWDLTDRKGRRLARRMFRELQHKSDQANLKQIGIALHNFHDAYKRFPPPGLPRNEREPKLSWRVRILPFLDELELYKAYKLDEPWDSEHNLRLVERMPKVFTHPGGKELPPGKTCYLAPLGADLSFSTTADRGGVRMREFIDGTSNTILVVEAAPDEAVIWTKPADLNVSADDIKRGMVGHRQVGFFALFADGQVHFVDETLPDELINAIFTRRGHEPVGSFFHDR